MGAATWPPVASLPRSPPFSTTTATAILRSPRSAKPMNQACGGLPLACWAVPVLPNTGVPGICANVPVPCWTTPSIISWSWPATRPGIACPRSLPSKRLTTPPSSETTWLATNGAIRRPPLAMVAATLAICSGDTRTSRWPMALWAVAGTSWSTGIELVAAGSS